MPARTATKPAHRRLAVRPRTVDVRSQTDPDTSYPVDLAYCPCADLHYRGGKPFCKHIAAAYMQLFGIDLSQLTAAPQDTVEVLVVHHHVTQVIQP